MTSIRARLQGALKSSNLKAALFRATGGSFALRVFAAGALFLISLALARLLGPQQYGLYEYAESWVEVLFVLATLGLDRLLVRFIAVYRARSQPGLMRGALRFAVYTSFAVALALAGLWALAAGVAFSRQPAAAFPGLLPLGIDVELHSDVRVLHVLWLALLMLPLRSLIRVRQGAAAGFGAVVPGQIAEFLIRPGGLLLLIGAAALLAPRSLSAALAVALSLAATAAAFLWSWRALRRALPPSLKLAPPQYETRAWLRSSASLVFIYGVGLANQRVGAIMLGTLADYEATALFGAASRMAELIALILVSANTAMGPIFARLYAEKNRDQLQALATRSTRLIFIVALALTGGLALLGVPLLALYGPDFTAAYPALLILALGQLVNVGAGSVQLLLNMTGHERDAAWGVAAGTAANIALNFWLIPPLGLIGAALATALSVALWNGLGAWSVWRRLGVYSTLLGKPRWR